MLMICNVCGWYVKREMKYLLSQARKPVPRNTPFSLHTPTAMKIQPHKRAQSLLVRYDVIMNLLV